MARNVAYQHMKHRTPEHTVVHEINTTRLNTHQREAPKPPMAQNVAYQQIKHHTPEHTNVTPLHTPEQTENDCSRITIAHYCLHRQCAASLLSAHY